MHYRFSGCQLLSGRAKSKVRKTIDSIIEMFIGRLPEYIRNSLAKVALLS